MKVVNGLYWSSEYLFGAFDNLSFEMRSNTILHAAVRILGFTNA